MSRNKKEQVVETLTDEEYQKIKDIPLFMWGSRFYKCTKCGHSFVLIDGDGWGSAFKVKKCPKCCDQKRKNLYKMCPQKDRKIIEMPENFMCSDSLNITNKYERFKPIMYEEKRNHVKIGDESKIFVIAFENYILGIIWNKTIISMIFKKCFFNTSDEAEKELHKLPYYYYMFEESEYYDFSFNNFSGFTIEMNNLLEKLIYENFSYKLTFFHLNKQKVI